MPAFAKRLTAFSHRPGAAALIPGTPWVVTGYPTRIAISHIETGEAHFWDLGLCGPVEKFTVEQDLEKGKVFIFGTAIEGYFRYALFAGDKKILCEKKRGVGPEFAPYTADVTPWEKPQARLTLGSAKKPDWDLVSRRSDLAEILPLWFALGQGLPAPKKPFDKTAFLAHFKAHFRDILVPKPADDLFQGIPSNGEIDPLSLLSGGAVAITSLFTEFDGKTLTILKNVPKEFHAGRLTGYRLSDTLTIDLTWSKKKLRTATFHAKAPTTLHLNIPFATYRIEKTTHKTSLPLHLDPGTTHLDLFEK